MEYTDEELMLLEQLTYLNDDVYDAAGISDNAYDYQSYKTVGTLLKAYGEDELSALEAMGDTEVTCDIDKNGDGQPDGTHISGAEWAAIIRAAQQNDRISQLEISNITTVPSGDGKGYNFDAMCFSESGNSKDAIVCFRGTLNGKEWADNGEYLCAADTDCNQAAMVYINGLPYSNITVVGHSKGANKAAYVYFGSDKVTYCVAMDMPGFPPEYYLQMAAAIEAKKDGINCYALESDFVNILVIPIPGVETKYCQGNGVANFAENHCPNSFLFYDQDGQPYAVITNNQTESMKILHNFTAFVALEMPYEERIKVGPYIGTILQVLMGDGIPDSYDKVDAILSDPDALTSVAAYFLKYCNTYDISMDDLFQVGLDIAFNNDKVKEAEFLAAIEAFKYGFSKFAEAQPEIAAVLVLILLVGGSIYAYTQLKDIINYIIEKLEGTSLIGDVKSKYTALTEFIDMVPQLNDNCGTEFDNTFNNEWNVDEHYMNVMATQMRQIDDCIHKFVLLKERMEYNVSVEY